MTTISGGLSYCLVSLVALTAGLSNQVNATRNVSRAVSPTLRAWPMVGHDAGRTNRTPVVVPKPYRLRWERSSVLGPVVSDAAGRVFGWGAGHFLAFDPRGHRLWSFPASEYEGGPPVFAGKQGIFAVGFDSQTIDPAQAQLFQLSPSSGHLVKGHSTNAFSKGVPPLVEGKRVYVPFIGPTEANAKLWRLETGKTSDLQPGFSFYAIAMSRAGDVFAIGRYSSDTENISLEALSSDGSVTWSLTLPYGEATVAVKGGTVYAVSGQYGQGSEIKTQVDAYSLAGTLKWSHELRQGLSTPAIENDGSVLVAGQLRLTLLSSQGRYLWSRPIPRSIDWAPSVAVDGQGTAYVGTETGKVAVVSRRGRMVTTIRSGPPRMRRVAQVAISASGHLLVCGADDRLRVYT